MYPILVAASWNTVADCAPTERDCRALVQRILASKEFQRTSRLRDFLLYVVDRKLADAPRVATEAVIGHRVFGRAAMYNTGEDSIVRTEARVLRQRLERYFSEDGLDEPIVLEIPKGSYVPVFHRRDVLGGIRRDAWIAFISRSSAEPIAARPWGHRPRLPYYSIAPNIPTIDQRNGDGTSHYNSLQLKAQKRFSSDCHFSLPTLIRRRWTIPPRSCIPTTTP